MTSNGNTSEPNGFPMAVVVEGGIVLVGMLFAVLFNVQVRLLLPADWAGLVRALVRGAAATVPMLVLFWWLLHSERPGFRELREQIEWLVGQLFPSGSVAQFALVSALAGVGEELVFRGVLQTVLARWTTVAVGLAVASLLFGAAHALSMTYFVMATVIGLYLGGLMIWYNDLVAPMAAHALYDFIALWYLSRRVQSRAKARTGDVGDSGGGAF